MKIERLIAVMMLAVLMLTGCGQTASQTDNTVVLPQINGEARNVIITESGQIFDADTGEEIILNTPQPSAEAAGQEVAEASPQPSEEPEIAVVQDAEVVVPHPEQSVSHVDTEKLGDDKLNIVSLETVSLIITGMRPVLLILRVLPVMRMCTIWQLPEQVQQLNMVRRKEMRTGHPEV